MANNLEYTPIIPSAPCAEDNMSLSSGYSYGSSYNKWRANEVDGAVGQSLSPAPLNIVKRKSKDASGSQPPVPSGSAPLAASPLAASPLVASAPSDIARSNGTLYDAFGNSEDDDLVRDILPLAASPLVTPPAGIEHSHGILYDSFGNSEADDLMRNILPAPLNIVKRKSQEDSNSQLLLPSGSALLATSPLGSLLPAAFLSSSSPHVKFLECTSAPDIEESRLKINRKPVSASGLAKVRIPYSSLLL